MATIAVDIDSTLYDFEGPSREAMWKLYKDTGEDIYKMGAYHPWTEWRSPNDVLGLEKWLDVIAMVHDSEIIRSRIPYAGAVETCQALIREGHELLYISNRATEAVGATQDWLLDQGFLRHGGYVEPKVLCLMEDKAPHMAKCQYLIDDRPKTVVQFVYDRQWANITYCDALGKSLVGKSGVFGVDEDRRAQYAIENERRAFVYGYPYNQALTDVPRVYVAMDWYGINEYLVRKGVLSEAAVQPLVV